MHTEKEKASKSRSYRRWLGASAVAALVAASISESPPARAAEPQIGECLSSAEAWLKLRSEHKLKASRAQLLVCSAPSCPAEVRQECMKHIDEVNAALPTIVLAVKNAGKELVAVKVTVDGQMVTDHLDGSAIPMDPGAHEFTFEASGLPSATQTIVLHEGEKDRRETIVLGAGEAPTPAPQPGAAAAAGPEAPARDTGGTQRALGWVAGGVGVAGIAVGSVFGLLASSSWKTAQSECPTHTGCVPQAMTDRNSALTNATISTVGFIAGGVLLATGVTLLLTAPSGSAPRVGLEVRPGGIALTGGF